MAMLRLDNVAMRYDGGPEVLRGVNLSLDPGGFHYIMGPSGAGKTSLLRLLSLIHPPCRGRVHLFGRNVAELSRSDLASVRRRVGVIFQDFRLLDHLSAFDNVALPLRISGARDEQISGFVSEILGWLGLADVIEAKPPVLSMGQRQLLAVARAVITRPGLLLADEPTASIDGKRADRLMNLFDQLHKLGSTVLFVTHNDHLVRRHPHPVLHMANGQLIAPAPESLAAAD